MQGIRVPLITGGGKDHTVPEVVARAAYKLYSGSGAVTDSTRSLTAGTRSSSITDGARSPTSPCPGLRAGASDARVIPGSCTFADDAHNLARPPCGSSSAIVV